jgi:dethiobiotin synthetase
MNCFITGTDTDCGKTFVTTLLVRTARARGVDVIGAKPVCCGPRDDVMALDSANGGVEALDVINPVWLMTPAAPRACELLGEPPPDYGRVLVAMRALSARHDHMLCEGAGGWTVPLGARYTIADFASELGWPVLVVARNRLGVLNHTLLTVESIQRRGLPLAGVILNDADPVADDPATRTNAQVLEEALGAPLLARVPHGATALEPAALFAPVGGG